MADLRKAAEMALETLQQLQGGCTDSDDGTVEAITVWCPEVIEALESALSQPAEGQEPVSECARTAPERIWLQADINEDRTDQPFEDDGVTWSAESVGGTEVEYVRADLANPSEAQAPDRWMIRYNEDGEFGQTTGWLYRDGGHPCIVTGKPVWVWRPLSDLLAKTGHQVTRPAAQPVQVQVPEGWAASLRHVCDQLSELDDDTVQAQLPSLRAMLAAAPLPPAQPQEPVNRRLLEALRYCIKQVPELATVPGVNCAIAEVEAQPFTFPERDSSKPAEQQGIFRKFIVQRVDGSDQPGGKHHGCRYFVLDLDHDQHAHAAMTAYGRSCAETHPALSDEILGSWPEPLAAQPVGREPLSRKALVDLWGDKSDGPSNSEIICFGRAVERAHGITGEGA